MWWTLPSSLCQDWGPHSPSWPGYRWIMDHSYIPSGNFPWPKGAALPRKPWKLGRNVEYYSQERVASGESGRQRRQCWEFLLDLPAERSLVTSAPEVRGRARYGLQWHEDRLRGSEEELDLGPEGKAECGAWECLPQRGWYKWRDPCWRRHLLWLEAEKIRGVAGKADGARAWLS